MDGVGEGDDDEANGRRGCIRRKAPAMSDAAGAGEFAVGVGKVAARFRKLLRGLPSSRCADAGFGVAYYDEAFVFIRDVEEGVDGSDGLLFIFRKLFAQGIERESGGRGDLRWRVAGFEEEALATSGKETGAEMTCWEERP